MRKVLDFIKRSGTIAFLLFVILFSLFFAPEQNVKILLLIFFFVFLGLDILNFLGMVSLRESFRQLRYIEELTGALRTSAKLSDVLDLAIKNLVEEFKYGKVAVFIFEHVSYRKDVLVLVAGHNIPMEEMKGFTFKYDKAEDIIPRAAVERNSYIIRNAKDDYRCSQSFVEKMALTEYAVVPLTMKEKVLGVFLAGEKTNGKKLIIEDLSMLTAYSNQTAFAIENARLFEQIEQLAITDALTSTYNQRYYKETLRKELERLARYYKDPTEKVSVILLELDNLKSYRERFGHHAGDTVLIEVGQILKQLTRKVDVVARYGGDEFALMLPSTGKEGSSLLAERIVNTIEEYPFENKAMLASKKISVTLGLAVYDEDAKDSEELMEIMSKRLREAKNKVKKGVSYL